jgi:molecular chaperone DnaK
VIKASSGLADKEIERMVQEAEMHAEEDRKFRELVDVRNQADGLVHSSEKALSDLGEKVQPEERASIESAIADLKTALKGDDKAVIEAKSRALSEAAAGMAQRVYQEQAQAEGDADGTGANTDAGGDAADVTDAEFEDVTPDDQKKSA